MLKQIVSITAMAASLGLTMAPVQGSEVRGVRADFVYEFRPGEGDVRNQDPKEAIGLEKTTLADALSLGVGGEIIVAYTRDTKSLSGVVCFYNVPGDDFFIHEPMTSNNRPETIEVIVSLEKNPSKTPWISLGVKSVKDSGGTNYIPFDLDENSGNIEIPQAYWILVRDAKSMLTTGGIYAGFEMSTAIIKAPCNDSMVSKRDELKSRLN